jgi:hypothetical protein
VCLFEDSAELLYQPVMPIIMPAKLDERLRDPDLAILQQYRSARELRANLDECERIYFAEAGHPELSALGKAVHEVRAAQESERRRVVG